MRGEGYRQVRVAPPRRAVGLGLALGCCLAALCGAAATTEAAYPGKPGKIVFERNVDPSGFQSAIFQMNPDGSGQSRLIGNPPAGDAFEPSFSGNGTLLIFDSNVLPTFAGDLFLANADGSGVINLTNTPDESEGGPSLSRDGTRIVFAGPGTGNTDLYTMNSDGTARTKLNNTDNQGDFGPVFSPDGTQVAFYGDIDPGPGFDSEIQKINADGSVQTRLTDRPGFDSDPDFSPDGQRIVFWGTVDNQTDIFVMNADGSRQTNLTNSSVDEETPVFSPDGRSIAYSRDGDGDGFPDEIFTMNADGSNQTNLTKTGGDDFDYAPGWQPEPVYCAGQLATIIGTDDPNTLIGTAGTDVIVGMGGKDLIKGLDGRDVLCGNHGNDKIRGNQGKDLLRGGKGRKDRCVGGRGRDRSKGCERGDRRGKKRKRK